MLCIIEIACLVFGIVILATGRVSLSAKKEVRGGPAYLIGLLLLAVFPLALGIGFIVGVQKAQQGQQANGLDPSLVLIDLGVVAGCTIPALIIAIATAKPKEAKRRKRRDEDYDDYDDRRDDYDRPRRRRDEDDAEDEDQPRGRRKWDDEDEDDRPRRRDDFDR
jgi:hypothetical protein